MIWFHKIPKLVLKAAIMPQENCLPILTAFLDIYLYLKSKNRACVNLLFIYFSLCIFAKFIMSFFLKILHQSAIRHNSSTFHSSNIYFGHRSQLKRIFLDFRVLRSKFVKFFMPNLKRQVDSSPNFVSLFIFMKGNSSVLF